MLGINCPISKTTSDRILLGHGSGGKMTQRLINDIFYKAFKNPLLEQDHDGCVFNVEKGRLAYSTDSFVVDPIFFPGGNIGDLAINGTVNDLACCGAIPKYLTVGFIIEEGLLISDLVQIVNSMKDAANKANIEIVAGDTKVVERGKCDKIFINTSGIGFIPDGVNISPKNAKEGDVIISTGCIGVHGSTILASRKELDFDINLKSDTVSLNKMLENVIAKIPSIHVMRDPTRGGVSGVLNEIAKASNVSIELDEASLPIPDAVYSISEILGLDPLYIANEGVALLILQERYAQEALNILKDFQEGKHATIIGSVISSGTISVRMKTIYGERKIINTLNSDQLPRIC